MYPFGPIDFHTAQSNEDGTLVVIEDERCLPFEVKRVFFIYGTPGKVVRGRHANRKVHQLIFCPSGSCDFTLDNGREKCQIRLDRPDRGIYVRNDIWREFTNFSPDCVVMVLASEPYDEADYLRDYDEFLAHIGKK